MSSKQIRIIVLDNDRRPRELGAPWWTEFARDYHNLVSDRLAKAAAVNKRLLVETVDATHYVMVSHAAMVAERIETFLQSFQVG